MNSSEIYQAAGIAAEMLRNSATSIPVMEFTTEFGQGATFSAEESEKLDAITNKTSPFIAVFPLGGEYTAIVFNRIRSDTYSAYVDSVYILSKGNGNWTLLSL